ncbi:MAG: hypothetical protein ACOX2D_01360 [Fermentimonas sp.]|jgi:hypothetical protein
MNKNETKENNSDIFHREVLIGFGINIPIFAIDVLTIEKKSNN